MLTVWSVGVLVTLLSLIRTSTAQHTEATCIPGMADWSFNSLQQSPCLITAYLGSVCSTTGDYDVPSIGPGFHYDPSQIPSICECTSVMYSLYSACACCQNATVNVWSDYILNCTSVLENGIFPFSIPPATRVPHYAYQQIESTDRFNVTEGQAEGDSPENNSHVQSSTFGISTTGSSTSSESSTSWTSSFASSTSNGSSTSGTSTTASSSSSESSTVGASTTVSSPSNESSTATVSTPASSSSSGAPRPTTSSSKRNSSPIGAIVWIAVGAVIAILIAEEFVEKGGNLYN